MRGLPLVGTREYGKEEGLFGGDFCWDPRAVHPYVLASRNRKVKHIGHFKELITKQAEVALFRDFQRKKKNVRIPKIHEKFSECFLVPKLNPVKTAFFMHPHKLNA